MWEFEANLCVCVRVFVHCVQSRALGSAFAPTQLTRQIYEPLLQQHQVKPALTYCSSASR